MTKINRPDTLLTELRDIKRRLRLLEAGRMRPPSAAMLASGTTLPLPVPLLPARPVDWPATESSEWERLSTAQIEPTFPATVELHLVTEPDTNGEARVLVDGQPVGEPVAVTPALAVHSVPVTPGSEITVEGRRSEGTGLVRVAALLRAG
jgi:hypothetical protein